MRTWTIQRTTVVIVFTMLFVLAFRVPIDTDTWWHLHTGDYMLSNGIVYADPFSFTYFGTPWVNYSWGSQLIMIAIWKLATNAGLAIFTSAMAVIGMAILYRISAGTIYARAFILVLGASTAAIFWTARPQMFSFVFSALLLYIVYSLKRHQKDYLYGIIPLMWVWGNLHAGWSIAYLFLFAFIVGEALNNLTQPDANIGWGAWRKLVLMTLASIPTLLISPYFVGNMLVPTNTVSIGPLRDFIQEWNTPYFQGRETWPFIGLIVVLFLTLWSSRLKFDWSSFFLLSGMLFLSLMYSRNMSIFAVVAVPIISYHLDDILTAKGLVLRPQQTVKPIQGMINLILAGLVVIAALVYCIGLVTPTAVETAQKQVLPVDAMAYLNSHDLPRQMFNSYNWGGYMMFTAPQYQVFIDGRTDIYNDFLIDYLAITLAHDGWQASLEQYGINLVVIERNTPLSAALRGDPAWQLAHEDELSVIFTRIEPIQSVP